jgi:hypothetical protein
MKIKIFFIKNNDLDFIEKNVIFSSNYTFLINLHIFFSNMIYCIKTKNN